MRIRKKFTTDLSPAGREVKAQKKETELTNCTNLNEFQKTVGADPCVRPQRCRVNIRKKLYHKYPVAINPHNVVFRTDKVMSL